MKLPFSKISPELILLDCDSEAFPLLQSELLSFMDSLRSEGGLNSFSEVKLYTCLSSRSSFEWLSTLSHSENTCSFLGSSRSKSTYMTGFVKTF